MTGRDCLRTTLLLACLASLSCGEYESCDRNYTFMNNVCHPKMDMSAPANSDAAVAQEAGSCNAAPAPVCSAESSGFGLACADVKDCPCGTTLCARQPGQSCGFCTKSGCAQNPAVCPAGWTCFDASAFQPGLSLCVQ